MRGLVLVACIVLIVACSALAAGWMKVAEDAAAATTRCEARMQKRVMDLPRIVIGLHVVYRGEALISTSDLQRQDSPMMTFEPLLKRLKDERRTECDVSHVCLDNLIVLETVASVQSNIVNLLVRTAWAAGYDIIMAPPRNNTW